MEPYQDLSRSIEGRTALITGAASGMGRATAHLFARQGANVAVTDLKQDAVDAVVKEIRDAGFTNVAGWAMDVSDPVTIKRVVNEAADHFGGLEILVNNAGFAIPADVGEESYEDSWEPTLNVMLSSHQRAIRAALPYMREAGWGRIVNVASTEGLGATPGNSPYAAAKHGVIGLTRGLAVDLGREGITVNCICPGPIRTGITDRIPDEHKEIFSKRRVPLRRYGIPEEVANITLSCVLPAASYLNGVHIPVDGGLTIKNA
ncbi:SDR family NAD(P)-dependent oxidoreductase [Henriciella sp.]|uniref:SDR family NAD(P)-dependent oxidoreductase n=1 Tax=Henriciella sp. TaxID=1968823 RepID=UPI002617DFE0|nr:SDR family NAD(P)-dependent oxidoreductase [Henriciella sp.]